LRAARLILEAYTTMVSTRVTSSSKSALQRNYARYHLHQKVVPKTSHTRFAAHWDTWYEAFAAEVSYEFPSYTRTQQRLEADSRWVTFAAKSLKTSEAALYSWLASSSPSL